MVIDCSTEELLTREKFVIFQKLLLLKKQLLLFYQFHLIERWGQGVGGMGIILIYFCFPLPLVFYFAFDLQRICKLHL